MNALFNIPDSFIIQASVIFISVLIYTISTLTGLNKGIQILSRYNVYLAIFLMLVILILGPSSFIIDSYIQGIGNMI